MKIRVLLSALLAANLLTASGAALANQRSQDTKIALLDQKQQALEELQATAQADASTTDANSADAPLSTDPMDVLGD